MKCKSTAILRATFIQHADYAKLLEKYCINPGWWIKSITSIIYVKQFHGIEFRESEQFLLHSGRSHHFPTLFSGYSNFQRKLSFRLFLLVLLIA